MRKVLKNRYIWNIPLMNDLDNCQKEDENMIYKFIKFKGVRGEIVRESLIDTGASISLIPLEIARRVGVWRIDQTINLVGAHGQSRVLPLGVVRIFFLDLGDKGGCFIVAISDVEREPIIGMDVLKPLGISIDTKTVGLSIKNEVWEAFKTLSAIGVVFFLGILVKRTLEKLFDIGE